MHEYSLMQQVIETILETLKKPGVCSPGSVKEVILKVGALDMHSEASCRQAYALLAKGTILEESRLTLVLVPATLNCPTCGYNGPGPEGQADGHDPMPYAECPSCGAVSGLLGGRGVETIELLLDEV